MNGHELKEFLNELTNDQLNSDVVWHVDGRLYDILVSTAWFNGAYGICLSDD